MSTAILVTGGAGFVGAHLAHALLKRKRKVVVLDTAERPPKPLVDAAATDQLVYIQGSVTEPGDLIKSIVSQGAVEIFHAAALLAEPESIREPRKFLRVNAEAVWDLCEIGRHVPTLRRIVAVSTRSVYGQYEPDEGPTDEDAAPRPVGFYGGAKACADLISKLYRRHFGLDVVAARITGAYGPWQRYPQPLSQMVDAATSGTEFRMESGADYLYELTYVKDVVRGLFALMDAPTLSFPVYNLGSGRQYRLSEVVSAVLEAVPTASITLGAGVPDGMTPRAALSVERIQNELSYRTRWSLEEGIDEYIRWKQHGDYGRPVEDP